jgi:hypothetical protein
MASYSMQGGPSEGKLGRVGLLLGSKNKGRFVSP